ncbi:MAG: 6,7-dimethyl-8-ribityllumazine synthase [Rhabdaerophilum calidifontis]
MAEAARRTLPTYPAPGAHVVIVEGRFYDDLNDMLIAGARRMLEAAGASVEIVTVPGALEIPVAIEIIRRQAAEGRRRADAFVALGVVIRGETTHYEIVSNESARALVALATLEALALGNGILTVEDFEQAEARANPAKGDKGGDAARAALALLALRRGEAA